MHLKSVNVMSDHTISGCTHHTTTIQHVSIEYLESNKQHCECIDVLMFHSITVCLCVVVFMLLSRK